MRLHNTLTGIVDDFTPISKSQVTMYTCGPTVYSEPLLGNWVAYLRWDLLVRTLKANGYTVKRVMNITDVGHLVSDADDGEDKMQKGAKREGVSAWEIADRYTNRFLEGMTALNLLPPEILSKATEHIDEQITLIQALEAKGHTYVIDDGVYFDTSTFPAYADFARLDLEALQAGARVEANVQKRNPSDFALWKFSPASEKRDMEWDSPWSPVGAKSDGQKGFPGWHIECSAMALKYLGDTIDIHTGGIDHIPVHHTNEIAQSEAATGKKFANYWLHANFLLANGTKISKSLGNGFTLNDLSEKGFTPYDFKIFVLQSHYRSESNFTWENITGAAARLKHWKTIACLRHQLLDTITNESSATDEMNKTLTDARDKALEMLSNDLSSPRALSVFEKALDHIEQADSGDIDQTTFTEFLQSIDDILGLDILSSTPNVSRNITVLLKERTRAREDKNWARSDELRDELFRQGIGVNDSVAGSRWYYL